MLRETARTRLKAPFACSRRPVFCRRGQPLTKKCPESPAAFAGYLVSGTPSTNVHRGGILQRRQNFTAAGLVRGSAAKRVWLPPRRKSTARGARELYSVAADSRCRSGLIPGAPLFSGPALRIQGLFGPRGTRAAKERAAPLTKARGSTAKRGTRSAQLPGPPEAGDVILAER